MRGEEGKRMRYALRIIAALVAAVLAIVGLAGGWLFWRFEGTAPKIAGEMAVEGADAAVRIVRDRHGVPHVFAESEADAFFGLGFAQAQDRIFQMDLTRRLMQGRLSELVGSRALAVDRRNRILGWSRTAEAQVAALSPQTRQALEAYARGVNAAIRAGATSPEYAVLLAKPEAWRLQDSLAAALAMTNQLTGGQETDVMERVLAAKLSPEQIDQFLSPYPDWAPRSFRSGELPFEAAPSPRAVLRSTDVERPGSNAWVVSGARTDTGAPVLANDPHLPLAAPGPFYFAHLTWPGRHLVGATLPGTPFVAIGHNGMVAWGATTHQIDAADLLPVPQAVDTREETIVARDWGGLRRRVETLQVASTTDGPVLPGQIFELGGSDQQFVLRTIADDPDNGIADAVYALSKADSVDAFFEATRPWVAPPQSLVVAAVDGDIGLISPGRFPLRDASGTWIDDIPFEGRLEAKNPPEGWFGTANNLMPPANYPYPLPGSHAPHRVTRIAEVLAEDPHHGPGRVRALHGDETSVMARRLLPAIAAATPRTEAGRQAQAALSAWNAVASQEAREPTLFAYWVRALGPFLHHDELGESLAEKFPNPPILFLDRVFTGDLGLWCDDVRTGPAETCPEVAGQALDAAALQIRADLGPEGEAWAWGKVHEAVFRNPVLSGLPLIGEHFTVRAPKGGDRTSVNVATGTDPTGGFNTTHAAGLRMVANLGDLNASVFQVTPGQSGHPASKHYRDLAPLWARNEGFEIRTDWTPETPPEGSATLTLRPR